MREGISLTNEDRTPWLETLPDALKERNRRKKCDTWVFSFGKKYRDILRSAGPNYKKGCYVSAVKFVLLNAVAEVLAARLDRRAAEGKQFMPPSLLQSQVTCFILMMSKG